MPGPLDLYAFDGYPGGTCHTDGTPGGPSTAPDWGIWGPGGAKGGASASPDTPGFTAEFGGGWFDYWGSVGTYPCTAIREGPGYERVFYETNIANRLTIQNFYMTFGGTSWGWLPAPVVYTSYDYGAAFDEARQIRAQGDRDEGDRPAPAGRARRGQARQGRSGHAVVARGPRLRRRQPGHRRPPVRRRARPVERHDR